MSIHLFPPSRRVFLQTTIAGGIVTLAERSASAAADTNANFWALLADTHIAGDAATVARGVNMVDNLNRVIDEILAEDPLPAGVIINGDCAYLKGLPDDYATLSKTLGRLTSAGVPIHLTMGNHDDREPLFQALSQQRDQSPPVEGKHVTILETPNANLFLLDSLKEVNVVTGELGEAQRKWLSSALSSREDKPAIVFGHHNPQVLPENSTQRVSGLADTQALMDLLDRHAHAQAYVYGHTHNWDVTQSPRQLRLINQPPVAYLFNPSKPNGWIRLEIGDQEMSLELRALDRTHDQHGEKHQLAYRNLAVKP